MLTTHKTHCYTLYNFQQTSWRHANVLLELVVLVELNKHNGDPFLPSPLCLFSSTKTTNSNSELACRSLPLLLSLLF